MCLCESQEIFDEVSLFINSFMFNLVSPLPTTLYRYQEYFVKMEKNNMFDLYLAATYLDNGVKQIYTANESDFVGISGLKAVNPYKK